MKLLGAPLSPFVRKAVIVAAEKNLDYEYDPRPSPLGWTEDFEKINPLKRIPALLPDPDNITYAINDSSAICAYFEKLQPEPALYPSDAEAYGRALWLEEAADTDLANKIGMLVFRPVFFNLAAGKAADIDGAKDGFEKLSELLLPYLESQIGDADWFAGDMFSIADIAVASQLMNLNMVGFAVPEDRFPNLRAHYERCIERPSIAACIEGNEKFISKSGFKIEHVIS